MTEHHFERSKQIEFRKMQGCGNDFIIIDERPSSRQSSTIHISSEIIARLSNRHTGIGCDQFIVLSNAGTDADILMTIFNQDGTISGACGNATRCVARILFEEDNSQSKTKIIQTNRGALICYKAVDKYKVDMGAPLLQPLDIPIKPDLDPFELVFKTPNINLTGTAVGMGNPHCVFFVDDIDQIDIKGIGSFVETHSNFPEKTNVEFVQIIDRQHVRQRTWERGVGETLACGSGACAVAVAGVLRDLTDRQGSIELLGGTLEIEWRENDGHVLMTGPAEHVFTGTVSL